MNKYIRICNLEIWVSNKSEWDIFSKDNGCKCFISSWGYIGFTLLKGRHR